MEMSWQAVKAALREVLEEDAGYGRYELAKKWDGGTLVFKPGDGALQAKEVPIEAFFKKITAVREKLRRLEQKVNNHPALSLEDRAELQQYLTQAYGSLTTFNVLFRDPDDRFAGARGE